MAVNKASVKGQTTFRLKDGNCVFISHKKEDEKAAIAISDYLNEVAGVNTYLDLDDIVLQEAVSLDNDRGIVDSINDGLSVSTHLLCLISEKTRLSWWVPYEIGIASSKKMPIASLKLKSIDDVPSFLKTETVLTNIPEFFNYSKTLEPYGGFLSKRQLTGHDKIRLLKYVEL